MDKFILSHLIKEILLENGRVILPGFGHFSKKPVSAYFSEDGRIINPPTSIITFTEDTSSDDDQLLERFAGKLGESADTLRSRMESLIQEIKEDIADSGSHVLSGFGTLIYSSDGIYTFNPESGKDFFQERLCMEPVMLRPIEKSQESHIEQTAEPEPQPEHQPEPQPEPQPPTVKKEKGLAPEEKRFRFFIILIVTLTFIIISSILLILGRNGAFDTILYSEEELELIESLQ